MLLQTSTRRHLPLWKLQRRQLATALPSSLASSMVRAPGPESTPVRLPAADWSLRKHWPSGLCCDISGQFLCSPHPAPVRAPLGHRERQAHPRGQPSPPASLHTGKGGEHLCGHRARRKVQRRLRGSWASHGLSFSLFPFCFLFLPSPSIPSFLSSLILLLH